MSPDQDTHKISTHRLFNFIARGAYSSRMLARSFGVTVRTVDRWKCGASVIEGTAAILFEIYEEDIDLFERRAGIAKKN